MHLNPESKALIDKLRDSQAIRATSTTIGPFDQTTRDVLQIIIENYEQLNDLSAEPRAKKFLEYYTSLLEDRAKSREEKEDEDTEKQLEEVSQEEAVQTKWYIHNVECHSIRGIDSYGETFPFSFEGKSNLIYGPNGSGKSSLLAAVIWAFTGTTITDASNEEPNTDIHKKTEGTKKGTRIRSDWPLISTLPESNDIRNVVPDSWVTIELKTEGESNTVYIKRSILSGLEAGTSVDTLKPCRSLEQYGIKPLDLQISLIAPTALSRNTLGNATDVVRILSMILGYDALEDIGALASAIGRNRTAYAKGKQVTVKSSWINLQEKLATLSDPFDEKSPVREKLQDLVKMDKPTLEELTDKNILIQGEIEAANKNVAKVLGVATEEEGSTEGLAESLIEAIAYLEKEFTVAFPSFAEVQYDVEQHGNKTIQETEEEFNEFCAQAQKRIQQRIDWWKREKEEGSKLSLKLRASSDYNPEEMQCPVCDQSIEDLPIKAELERLKTLDSELQRELEDFFKKDLSEELERIVSDDIKNIAKSLPSERILADWKKTKDSVDHRLKNVFDEYDSKIESLCETLQEITVEPMAFFTETDEELLNASDAFIKACNDSLKATAILEWANIHFESTKEQLQRLLTSSEQPSLLSQLSKSKSKASDTKPLGITKTRLEEIIKLRKNIVADEAELNLAESLELPIKKIKQLSKYALEKTGEIFSEIETVWGQKWKLLYDESPTGLTPSKLVLDRGKTIEPFLWKRNYEVVGKYFANAGLQRSIALSFLCALIEKYHESVSFVLFDDPILSLDEDHRESWLRKVVCPLMKDIQIVLATHQEQFLNNTRQDFIDERILTLNPRTREKRLSIEPGHLLGQAEYWLEHKWEFVPGLLYQYVEHLLETLDSYSPDAFFDKDRLTHSFEAYKNLPDGNPLNSKKKSTIVNTLTECFRDDVFRKRHLPTSPDVTKPMTEDAYRKLSELDGKAFKIELRNLKKLRARQLRGNVLTDSVVEVSAALNVTFNSRSNIPMIGRAAARPEAWVVDGAEQETTEAIENYACVHVTGNTFDPVARYGQCVLVSHSDDMPVDGDLVVGESGEQIKYLQLSAASAFSAVRMPCFGHLAI